MFCQAPLNVWWSGLAPHQLAQVVAARELLSISGHDPAVVVPSKVPFRG